MPPCGDDQAGEDPAEAAARPRRREAEAPASGPARRARTWPGTMIRAGSRTCSGRGLCVRHRPEKYAADLGVVSIRSVACRRRSGCRPCSTTGTRWDARAAGCMPRARRRKPAAPRRAPSPTGWASRPGGASDGNAPRACRAVHGHRRSMAGTRPSDGGALAVARAAGAVAAANTTIRALILLARVDLAVTDAGCASPVPARRSTSRSRAPACSPITSWASGPCPRSGASSTATCTAPSSSTTATGIQSFDGISHQLCTAHLLRDLQDTADTCRTRSGPPRSPASCAPSSTPPTWPGTRAWPRSRTRDRPPGTSSCSATASTPASRRSAGSPAARTSSSPPPCTCWNASSTPRPTCCVSSPTPPSRPPATRPNATCGPRKHSRRSAAGSAPRPSPGTATPFAATHPPPASTASTCSPRSRTLSPETPGYHLSRPCLNSAGTNHAQLYQA